MALAGAWLQAASGSDDKYPTPSRWGTNINSIHASRNGGAGRGTAVNGSDVLVEQELTDDDPGGMEYGYTDDDMSSVVYGDSFASGTRDRRNWGEESDSAAVLPGYPSYGPYAVGQPGGAAIRTLNHGADATNTMKATQPSLIDVAMSPPEHGDVEDAVTSDPSQYEMQTSMTQRDKVREGSQAASGRANDARSRIASRIIGQRVKNLNSNPSRHDDMQPKEQALMVRPFWIRTAGTGRKADMATNEMYRSQPRQRVAPDNPWQGDDAVAEATNASAFGYTDEDYSTW